MERTKLTLLSGTLLSVSLSGSGLAAQPSSDAASLATLRDGVLCYSAEVEIDEEPDEELFGEGSDSSSDSSGEDADTPMSATNNRRKRKRHNIGRNARSSPPPSPARKRAKKRVPIPEADREHGTDVVEDLTKALVKYHNGASDSKDMSVELVLTDEQRELMKDIGHKLRGQNC